MSAIQTPPQPSVSAISGSDSSAGSAPAPQGDRLPTIRTALAKSEIIERLRTASKRGRLAGFETPRSDADFAVAAHGNPFDSLLLGTIEADRVSFRLKALRKLPIIFAIVLLATIWPGVYFMDALIPGEWGWIPTSWWYLPITIIPIPWAWRSMQRKSKIAVDASARAAIEKIAKETDGTIE